LPVLRGRLRQSADEPVGLGVHQLPGLGLERRLQLLVGPGADLRLHRDPTGYGASVETHLPSLAGG
jgi:hypothetical protein